jgi:hypothetical protein
VNSRIRKQLAILTLTWLLTLSTLCVFAVVVVEWPTKLVLLFLLPIFVLWVPASYPLTIASAEGYAHDGSNRQGTLLDPSFGLLGALTVGIGLSVLWSASIISQGAFGYLVLSVVPGLLCLRIAVRIYRQVLEDLRQSKKRASW